MRRDWRSALSRTFPTARKHFVLVNLVTSLNLLMGVLSLLATLTGSFRLAAWGLLWCVLIDACDGLLARHWDVTSSFGAQFDSLADMTSFVTAGATLIYAWAQPITPYLIMGASGLYVLSGAVRLARFNCTTAQPGYFQGMPTTFVAAAVATTYLVSPLMDPYVVTACTMLLAGLMVSLFPYPKPSPAMLRRWLPWFLALLGIGAVTQLAWAVWLLSAGYTASGPVIWVRRKLQPAV